MTATTEFRLFICIEDLVWRRYKCVSVQNHEIDGVALVPGGISSVYYSLVVWRMPNKAQMKEGGVCRDLSER